jgi:DNA invertase Pin-like site-specific DNA recombinase
MTTSTTSKRTRRATKSTGTCVIYCRISSDPDDTGDGVERQEEDCRALAAKLGLTVVGFFVDNDVSAYARTRPDWERLLAYVATNDVDALVAWHPDRLYRQPRELEGLLDLLDAGRLPAAVRTVTAGDVDLSTETGQAVARTMVAWSHHEVQHARKRMLRAHRQRAEQGKPNGGARPFGFEEDKVTHRPGEAAMVREAARRVLDGEALSSIVRDWKARGVTTPGSSSALRYMLIAPRTAGLREHRGEIVGEAVWDPILDRDTWERVRATFADPERRRRGGRQPEDGRPRRRYWLRGLLVCGKCGTKLISVGGGGAAGRYACPLPSSVTAPGCGGIYVGADSIERHVAKLLFDRLTSSDFGDLETAPEGTRRAEVLAELDAVSRRLAEIGEAIGTGTLTVAVGAAAERVALATQQRLDTELRRLSLPKRVVDLPDNLDWLDFQQATGDELHEVASWGLAEVVVNPAPRRTNRFDPERLDVRWADRAAEEAA